MLQLNRRNNDEQIDHLGYDRFFPNRSLLLEMA